MNFADWSMNVLTNKATDLTSTCITKRTTKIENFQESVGIISNFRHHDIRPIDPCLCVYIVILLKILFHCMEAAGSTRGLWSLWKDKQQSSTGFSYFFRIHHFSCGWQLKLTKVLVNLIASNDYQIQHNQSCFILFFKWIEMVENIRSCWNHQRTYKRNTIPGFYLVKNVMSNTQVKPKKPRDRTLELW